MKIKLKTENKKQEIKINDKDEGREKCDDKNEDEDKAKNKYSHQK